MQAKSAKQTNQTIQPIEMHKKYKTRGGHPVRILCTDRKSENVNYSVVALLPTHDGNETCAYYTVYGSYLSDCEVHDSDLIEVQPWDDFKIDDPVLVSDDGKGWHKRYFAGVNSFGKPLAFGHGATSFSVLYPEDVCVWDFCKKPEEK